LKWERMLNIPAKLGHINYLFTKYVRFGMDY